MPATLSDAGLAIQTQAEILAEIQADLQDPITGFGPQHDVTSPTSPVAILAGVAARREAQYQSLLASATSALYPGGASGTMLDRQATIVGAPKRIEESNSTILARLFGSPGTDVSNKLVRYVPNQSLWRTPGLSFLNGAGELETTLRAETAGPVNAEVSVDWEIVSTTQGWDSIISNEDAQLGELEEDDPDMRDRLAQTDSVGRGTEPAIYARLLEIPGVSQIAVDNNRELFPNINGVPGKSVESLVVGGEDATIAEVLHETYECDSGSFGNTTVTFVNRFKKTITIRFSRVDEIFVYVTVTLQTTGAEVPLPPDYEDQVRQAIVNRVAQITPGQDLHSAWFVGAIVTALPVNSVVAVTVEFSLNPSGPFTLFVPLTSRQIAIVPAGGVPAQVDSLQKPQGFDITTTWHLDLSIDGGPTVSTVFVGGVGLTSTNVAAQIQAAFLGAGETATATGALNRIRIQTATTGSGSSIEILNTSTVGLLAVLGNEFAVPNTFFGVDDSIVAIDLV